MERYEQFLARHPRIKWGSGLSGGLLAIIGLSSLPGDLENWSVAFQGIGSELGRWILVAVGVGVMVAVLVARRVPPARDSSDKHAYLKTEEARNKRIAAKALAGRRKKHLALALKIVEDELGIASHEARVLVELGTRDPVDAALARTIFPKWKGQTSNFIEVVLGQAARAKFDGHPDDGAEQARQCLLEMAADISAAKIRLSGPDLAHAVETRGINEVSTIIQRSEAVRSAPSPAVPASGGEFGRRDDPGELARRCHMLAGSIERWVESFSRGHSERAEQMVKEWMEADPATDESEARRKAYTRDEKIREADYRLKFEAEAKELFNEAYEMGEIAKEHERLATAPLAIEFEAVPRLFNEIASRLYGEVPKNLFS